MTTTIPPSGLGLPEGSGSYDLGETIYVQRCLSCHGAELEGTSTGLRLIGGRGSLATENPVKTVESFWPYATSLFSYIRNTMPITEPGMLSDDETYAVLAYILVRSGIIQRDDVLSAETLPDVHMPNVNGFVPDPRPDIVRQREIAGATKRPY